MMKEKPLQVGLGNKSGWLSKVILEPWAEELVVQAGDQILVTAQGPGEKIEVEVEEGEAVLYCSSGMTLIVTINGKRLEGMACSAIPAL
ncbi:hypothetical protein [Chitiniphilus eburneus]|uniref:Uncharacterized protein n=1 Tax=Chitiniphilus eburneus TaxID=2571148 RepID=A0A4U0Q583_9NEIS|nr:hypothetical protein [Chitiniphilus eburneus]TJZ76336.1 hypothetical protein FAZ21_06070 [Chitiniphilus eburneus]